MTRLPLEDHDVVPFEGELYDLNAVCAAPGCDQPSRDPHHLWRRSFLGGAFNYVLIRGLNVVCGNVVGLCRTHHDQVEGTAAWITLEFDPRFGLGFYWTTLLTASERLVWQPPITKNETPLVGGMREFVETNVPESGPEVFGGSPGDAAEAGPGGDVGPPSGPEHDHSGDGVCPSCKRPLPRPKVDSPPEAKRARRTWSITVPADEREDGADTLDALLEASRDEMAKLGLPYGETDSVRFFVLAAALGLFVQHAAGLMGDA